VQQITRLQLVLAVLEQVVMKPMLVVVLIQFFLLLHLQVVVEVDLVEILLPLVQLVVQAAVVVMLPHLQQVVQVQQVKEMMVAQVHLPLDNHLEAVAVVALTQLVLVAVLQVQAAQVQHLPLLVLQ
jgi:hypothetical protein